MVNIFIESLQRVSQLLWLQLVVKEHFFEFRDHTIENSSRDLYKTKWRKKTVSFAK